MTEFFAAPDRFDTDDFTIRSYMPCDGPLVTEATDGSWDHLKRFMLWAKEKLPPEEAAHTARLFRSQYLRGTDFPLAVVSPDGKRLLGSSGFHLRGRPMGEGVAEVGMWIRVDEAGKGLGTAVLVELLRWAFDAWPWRLVFWRCSVENAASIRTAEKAGLIREGVLRQRTLVRGEGFHDTVYYSALRDEWRPPE